MHNAHVDRRTFVTYSWRFFSFLDFLISSLKVSIALCYQLYIRLQVTL